MHQWFGNLVTCDWWDEIYVNEAFGSIGGYLGLSMTGTEAEFQWEDEYLCSQTFSGMITDSFNSSRPMVNRQNNDETNQNYPVDSPARISKQFDNIGYNKAGSVMMMIRALIGDNLWTQALHNYLEDRKFKTGQWFHLLDHFDSVVENSSDKDLLNFDGHKIRSVFEPYFLQMGLPMLKISVSGKNLKIYTDRFFADQVEDKMWPTSSFGYKWTVPLIVQEYGQKKVYWLDDAGHEREFEVELQTDQFVLDPSANTWSRIKYPVSYISRLAIKPEEISAMSVAKMMQDQYQFLQSDYAEIYEADINGLLELTLLLKNQDDHTKWIMWRELDSNIFDRLDAIVVPYLLKNDEGDLVDGYLQYMRSTFEKLFNNVYPDKSTKVSYDIKKARASPYAARLMLKYYAQAKFPQKILR